MAAAMNNTEQNVYVYTWCKRLKTATEMKDLDTIREMVDSLQSPDDQRYPLRSIVTERSWHAQQIVNTLEQVEGVDSQTIAQFLVQANCPITHVVHNADIVEHMIRLGSSVNYVPNNNVPALHKAITCGPTDCRSRLRLIELLLNNGADCNYIDFVGASPLDKLIGGCLIDKDRLEVLRLLVSRGVQSNSSVLLTALIRNLPREVIQLLMQVDTNVRFRDDRSFADLYEMIISTYRYNQDQDAVEYLVDLGMDPKTLSSDGISMLYYAFAKVSLEYLRYLVLVCGVELYAKITPLNTKNILCITTLLSKIIEKNQQDYEDAAKRIRLCLLRGADINGWGSNSEKLLGLCQKDKWIDLRLEQTAINEFMDLPVDKPIANIFYNDRNYVSYIAACKYELVALMDTQFYNHITLFNILTDGDSKMMNYVGNEELLKAFRKFDKKYLFPIYWPALTERFDQFLYLHVIRQKAMEVLCCVLPSINNYEVVQVIAKHLSIMDLFKLSKFHRE